jgi:hypothetical protein
MEGINKMVKLQIDHIKTLLSVINKDYPHLNGSIYFDQSLDTETPIKLSLNDKLREFEIHISPFLSYDKILKLLTGAFATLIAGDCYGDAHEKIMIALVDKLNDLTNALHQEQMNCLH